MTHHVTSDEARLALNTVGRNRRRVIDEIDLPAWYWWGLAIGWIGLGLLNDLANAWLTAAATLVFGAVHASVAGRVADGRHRSHALSVRADVAGTHVAARVVGGLIALGGLTVAAALAAHADGAQHPATMASVLVATIILLGGPRLLAHVRRRAVRASAPA